MNLTTLEMPVEEAKARLTEYEQMIATERTAEDDAIAAGYRAAARGLPVIMLTEVFNAGGWFPNGLPRLAIARADAKEVRVEVRGHNTREIVFTDDDAGDNRGALVGRNTVRVNGLTPPTTIDRQWRGRTIVPLIPPRHRPRLRRLRGFHVLWEVERWTPAPSKDPALVRHIRGDLWSVVATWDLTDLEMAVLSQRSPRR